MNIKELANYLLSKNSMTNKKLQKMIYYITGWHVALLDKDLIPHDNFEAWVHGPVCPDLYHKYKNYGWKDIPKIFDYSCTEISVDSKELIDEVIERYGDYSGDDLEALSHQEQPWLEAREGLEEWHPSTKIISKEVMRKYFLKLYEEAQYD